MSACIGRTLNELHYGWPGAWSCIMNLRNDAGSKSAYRFLLDHDGGGFTIKAVGSHPSLPKVRWTDLSAGNSEELFKLFEYARRHYGGGVGLTFGRGIGHRLRIDGRDAYGFGRSVFIYRDDGNGAKIIEDGKPGFSALYLAAKAEYLDEDAQDPDQPIIDGEDITEGVQQVERLLWVTLGIASLYFGAKAIGFLSTGRKAARIGRKRHD